MGEICPESEWIEIANSPDDGGKLVRAVIKSMNEYAKQCLLQAVERIEQKRDGINYHNQSLPHGTIMGLELSAGIIRQLLKEQE